MGLEMIRWIRVEEELPDVELTVLVHSPRSDEPIWLGWYDGVFWFAVDGSEYQDGDVIEWAQLPKGASIEDPLGNGVATPRGDGRTGGERRISPPQACSEPVAPDPGKPGGLR